MTTRVSPHRSALLLASIAACFATPGWALTPGNRSLASAPRVILGDEPGEGFGSVVALPGDITGDGVPDLLVGAPTAAGGAGRVYLFSGATILDARALRSEDAWATFDGPEGSATGTELEVLGDVDGDGWIDWGVGAPRFLGGDAPPGRLWVLSGARTVAEAAPGELSLDDAIVRLDGPNDGATLGEGFAAAGDVNGDGFSDFATLVRVADTDSDAGTLLVVHGRSAGNWPLTPSLPLLAEFSFTVSGLGDPDLDFTLSDLLAPAGDVDGDGLGDLWLGLPGFTGGSLRSGTLLLLPGRIAGEGVAADAALAMLVPEPAMLDAVDVVDAHFGQPVTSLRDGTVWAGLEGPARGGALGFSFAEGLLPSQGSLVAALRSEEGAPGALRVLRADLDGDGAASIITGSPRHGEGPGRPGAGRLVVLPSTLNTLHELSDAFATFEGLDSQRVTSGLEVVNLDGDGYDDAVLGGPGAYGTGAVFVLLGAELADGDGFAPMEGDCDDAVATVFPGALEISHCADNLDNDCNGQVDADDGPCRVEGSGILVGCAITHAPGPASPWLLLLASVPLLAGRPRRSRSGARQAAVLLCRVRAGSAARAFVAHTAVTLALLLSLSCTSSEGGGFIPSVRFTAPVAGARLPDDSVLAVAVQVDGGRLAPEGGGGGGRGRGGGPRGGEGEPTPALGPDDPVVPRPVLWALSIDGFVRGVGGGPVLVAEGLTPGVHILRAELLDTEGAALQPPVVQEISVEIVAGNPSVAITAPTDAAVVAPAGFEVAYDVGGFLLNAASIGGANQLGVGHALVTVDDSIVALDTDGRAFVANLPAGTHELGVELVNNDGSSLAVPARDVITVIVAEPVVRILTPVADEIVTGSTVELTYEVENFTLDPINVNGAPEGGRGHVHVYLDGLYQGLDATGSFAIPGVTGCAHTLRLELALGGHAELGLSDEVEFALQPCLDLESPLPDATVVGPDVTVAYTSPGFVIDGTLPAAGGRYVTRYVDGVFVGTSTTAGNAAFTGVPPGPRLLQLRLAEGPVTLGNEVEGELAPLIAAEVSVQVQ